MSMNTGKYFVKSLLSKPVLTLRWVLGRPTKKTNEQRWSQLGSLDPDWDERTIMIGSLVPPNSSVLEFGAGRMVLRDHLPSDCEYQGSDIVDRGPGTIVCDLNKGLPSLKKHYSHTVFSGVLEYITDLDNLLSQLHGKTDKIIASYATMDNLSCWLTRRRSGWLNDFTDKELIYKFRNHSFFLERKLQWRNQNIYIFYTEIS